MSCWFLAELVTVSELTELYKTACVTGLFPARTPLKYLIVFTTSCGMHLIEKWELTAPPCITGSDFNLI